MIAESFSPDNVKPLPNLKEATSLASTTTGLGVLAFQHGFYWLVWQSMMGFHSTPIKKWNKEITSLEVKANTEDLFISKDAAKKIFDKLVESGLVPLYVKYITVDLAGKKVPKNLSVRTLEECLKADRFFSYEVPVYTFGDLKTGWNYYPANEYLEDFGPTIAKMLE